MRISSRRVPDASTSTAGKMRLSASERESLSSILPVPLNSSKMTSSALEPVSTSAVAKMVSEPPCSMLRAAPKKRLGGYSAEERSEEHTSELQSRGHLVCRLLLEKKKQKL